MISYELIAADRKTLSILITPEGRVQVRYPRRMPRRTVESLIAEKEAWIQAKLEKLQSLPKAEKMTRQELLALKKQASAVFASRAAYFAPLVDVSYGKITVRFQKSRWGSCGPSGNLSFNGLLLLAPPEILDYVVVHELCHRKEMNHSAAFWALVGAVLPDWKECRRWLKENGCALICCLPE